MPDTSNESEPTPPQDFGETYLREVLGLTQEEVDSLSVHPRPEHPKYVEVPEKYKRLASQRKSESGGHLEAQDEIDALSTPPAPEHPNDVLPQDKPSRQEERRTSESGGHLEGQRDWATTDVEGRCASRSRGTRTPM